MMDLHRNYLNNLKKQNLTKCKPLFIYDFIFQIPPQNFSNNLLYWTRATLGLEYTQIASAIAANNVNTDELGCNPHDIGCHCCPF